MRAWCDACEAETGRLTAGTCARCVGRKGGLAAGVSMSHEQKQARARKAFAASAASGNNHVLNLTDEQRTDLGVKYGPAASYRAGRVRLQAAIERKRELIPELEAELAALERRHQAEV